MHSDDFFQVIDKLSASCKLVQATDVMRDFVAQSGLSNMSYAALNLPGTGSGRPLLAMTYTPEWQRHYAQRRYVDVDPVVKAGLGGILPVDWSEIDRSSPIVKKFFGEAQELKVGSQGLSIPVRGRLGEFALVSFTADVSSHEWRLKQHDLMRNAMVLAFNFHAAALRSVQLANAESPSLTHRESSCLRWKAQGKSDSEIATILSISPHTVRFHLECARTRLNAGNATHAVALAISLGLINLACEPSSI